MIDGLSGGNLTVAQAYISDITEPRERAKIFGMIIGVSFGLGFTIGPGLGAIISSRFGYDITAYLAALFSLSSIIATFRLLPETQHQRDEARPRGLAMYTRVLDYLRIVELRPLLAVFFFLSLPFTTLHDDVCALRQKSARLRHQASRIFSGAGRAARASSGRAE